MKNVLEVKELEKSYSGKRVVKELTFQIHEGEILCLLGPNGAGKSTTMNMICGLVGYDGGKIFWENQEMSRCLNRFKEKLGVVPQELAIYEDLSALKNVTFFASLYGLKGKQLKEQVEKALKFSGLWERREDKAGTFSGGMKRRLNIACAIAHKPQLLIMDEPTVGIDPQSRNHILTAIKKLKEQGMTILYTTHYMEEVEEISDRILIMDAGNIIAEGTKESLKETLFDERQYVLEIENADQIREEQLYKIDGLKKAEKKETMLTITCVKNMDNLDQIIYEITKQHGKIKYLTTREATLENVFLKLTGKSLRD